MKDKINIHRELLHRELSHEDLEPNSKDYKKLLKLSQELDKLIIEYYNEDNKKSYWFLAIKSL